MSAVDPELRAADGVHYARLQARNLGKFYSGISAVREVNFSMFTYTMAGLEVELCALLVRFSSRSFCWRCWRLCSGGRGCAGRES